MSENLHEKKTRVGFTNPAPVYVRFFIFPLQSPLPIRIERTTLCYAELPLIN